MANNSRVIPARLHGRRPGGGRFEALLLTPLPLIEAGAVRLPARPEGWPETAAGKSADAACGSAPFAPIVKAAADETGASGPAGMPGEDGENGAPGASGGWFESRATVLLRPAKKLKIGQSYELDEPDELSKPENLGGLGARGELHEPGKPGGLSGPGEFGEQVAPSKQDKPYKQDKQEPGAPGIQGEPGDPAKNGTPGEGGEGSALRFTLLERGEFGQAEVLLQWKGSLLDRVCACGSLPLPPYIRREAAPEDLERYQTTFCDASKAGSVAAPTAGLHFTPQMRHKLQELGHEWAELTLFVGYGTFSPVRAEDIRDHLMHPEYVEISAETVEKIRRAKAEGRPVIAVGTTSTRVLEGLAEREALAASRPGPVGAELLKPYTGWLNCFIYPGKPIRIIDGLITNFHLPESTLLMLVSALCGRERLLAAYRRAVRENFRFFSYGDAMLIL